MLFSVELSQEEVSLGSDYLYFFFFLQKRYCH